ncbi:hypothetical protein [Thiothrix winogradskyi]|uniref:Uncharacterized protein n=1 Tax=Thiothrix winogradskyi TaxID=96472 RepID=A0ABY3T3T0_9GAMM|nr:hypothetical protein [Thiothrix winogradskyi]UJS26269.1 hypothetical protein L2Y54_09580 [Thiothrix winogradskyi]
MTNIQLYQYLTTQSGAQTVATIAINTGISEAEAFALLVDNEGALFTRQNTDPDAMLDTWGVNPAYADTLNDADALTALTAAICTAQTCNNDVDTVLAATGATKADWQRGSSNMNALVDMLRCGTLRTKLQGLGLDVAKLDGMLDSCDTALLVNDAMITHHGVAGV